MTSSGWLISMPGGRVGGMACVSRLFAVACIRFGVGLFPLRERSLQRGKGETHTADWFVRARFGFSGSLELLPEGVGELLKHDVGNLVDHPSAHLCQDAYHIQ